ncbi:TPA: hypothetical protein ACSP2E_003749 [Aeromonas hydrophila]
MDLIADAFNNAIMQSMVVGPIMGVVFGVLFSGLTERPEINAPVTVVQTKNVYVTKMSQQQGGSRSSSSSDEGAAMALVLAAGFIVWKYVVYVNVIHYYMSLTLLFAIAFSLTSILVAVMKSQVTSKEWLIYLISPSILLGVCLYLFNLAHSTFDPELSKLAIQYNVYEFYFNALSDYGLKFVLMHVFGVVLLFVVVLLIVFSQLHYLSLMNQRSYGFMQPFWLALTRITYIFSGRRWLLVSSILLGMSYFSIDPNSAALWLSK